VVQEFRRFHGTPGRGDQGLAERGAADDGRRDGNRGGVDGAGCVQEPLADEKE
jgi:hypothetical protein